MSVPASAALLNPRVSDSSLAALVEKRAAGGPLHDDEDVGSHFDQIDLVRLTILPQGRLE
jgi:hypothetical protein